MTVAGTRPELNSTATVITVFNQKGGIGKTTTSINLATCLAALGHRVVLVDLDSQSNASTGVGVTAPAPTGAYQLITGQAKFAECIRPTAFEGLSLCAGSDDLAWADIELAGLPEPQLALSRALASVPAIWDYVVIDCPPAPGIVSVNALVAADAVVMPVVPSPHALDGLRKAWWNVNRVRRNYNSELRLAGVLLTMTEDEALPRELAETIGAEFGGRVLPVAVPRDHVVTEAAARDVPVAVLAPGSAPATAYLRLAISLRDTLDIECGPGGDGWDQAIDRLGAWHDVVLERPWDRSERPGSPPETGWAVSAPSGPSLTEADVIGWKLAVGAALILLGAMLGFVAGRL